MVKDRERARNKQAAVAVDADYGKEDYGRNEIMLPKVVGQLYGCDNCEWKSTPSCPFGYQVGKGHHKKDNRHTKGICQDRTNYLKGFYSGAKERPTYAEWMSDFNKGMLQLQTMKSYKLMKDIEIKIIDTEEFLVNEPQNEHLKKELGRLKHGGNPS